jgi:hypothetical protein
VAGSRAVNFYITCIILEYICVWCSVTRIIRERFKLTCNDLDVLKHVRGGGGAAVQSLHCDNSNRRSAYLKCRQCALKFKLFIFYET